MSWFVCQSGAKFAITFQVIRPTTAVSEHDDFGEALREKERRELERMAAQRKEAKP